MESQIWLLARSGNVDAIGEILTQLQGCTLSGARKKGSIARRSDPEDASQIALLKAYSALAAGEFATATLEEFKTYLFRKGRCCANQEIRRQLAKRRSASVESGDVETVASSVDHTAALETYEQIAALLEHFADQEYYAEIVRLLGDGYTRPEIAKTLSITIDQVGSRIKRIHAWAEKVAA